ncbi:MAG TPA: carboxylating nicotinate-nucleotide diphosphorylase [Hyphomicrobiales bacterium]|nr:carboxylating nicotinate-nucleotide diphosphorylase [Hyphomicrobiales bacterium]
MDEAFLNPLLIARAVDAALDEDLGRAGDITSAATLPAGAMARAVMRARRLGVVAGLPLALAAFRRLGPELWVEERVHDGARVEAGDALVVIEGSAHAILGAERVALNFAGHLSGVATATAAFAARIAHTRARIVCTRKTTPGLRVFEKHAVRSGGGANHRFGLDDAVLIKDNHIAVAGGVAPALRAAKRAVGHLVKIEIEVDGLDQLDEVLREGADAVLLDNFDVEMLAEAVRRVDGRMTTEASGGITLDRVATIAETGVDLLSSGWITHSAPSLDIGLDIEMA